MLLNMKTSGRKKKVITMHSIAQGHNKIIIALPKNVLSLHCYVTFLTKNDQFLNGHRIKSLLTSIIGQESVFKPEDGVK